MVDREFMRIIQKGKVKIALKKDRTKERSGARWHTYRGPEMLRGERGAVRVEEKYYHPLLQEQG